MGIFNRLFAKKEEPFSLIERLEGLDQNESSFRKPESEAPWIEAALKKFYSLKEGNSLDEFIKKIRSWRKWRIG